MLKSCTCSWHLATSRFHSCASLCSHGNDFSNFSLSICFQQIFEHKRWCMVVASTWPCLSEAVRHWTLWGWRRLSLNMVFPCMLAWFMILTADAGLFLMAKGIRFVIGGYVLHNITTISCFRRHQSHTRCIGSLRSSCLLNLKVCHQP